MDNKATALGVAIDIAYAEKSDYVPDGAIGKLSFKE